MNDELPDGTVVGAKGSRRYLRWGERLERRHPGTRFGIVLLLLLFTFVFMATGQTGAWVPLGQVVLQGTTLLAALAASEARVRVVRFAVVVIAVGLIVAVVALIENSANSRGLVSILSILLVGVAPAAIAQSLVRRGQVDIDTVLGAICIYVLIGMLFAFVDAAIGYLGSMHFFAHRAAETSANYVYFSFVTLTTVGYGDLTAAGGFGRAVAALEGLSGQLYLVTVVAVVVSLLVRSPGRAEPS